MVQRVFEFRQAGLEDAAAVGASVAAGFRRYREFAPPFWRPPEEATLVDGVRRWFAAGGGFWCLLAERDGALAGQVSFMPAAASVAPVDEPKLAHLSGLFVEPSWWGSGLARTLHGRALAEAAVRGYASMRLFTPAGQARARRFYEREGWRPAGEPNEMAAGLPTLEYRRAVA